LFLILFNYAIDWITQQTPADHLGIAISPEDHITDLVCANKHSALRENTEGSASGAEQPCSLEQINRA